MPRPLRPLGRRGVAALEFGLIAPMLIVIVMSMTDVANAVIAWWQITEAADAIGLIATNLAATTSNTNSLSDLQAAAAGTAIYALQPGLLTTPPAGFGVVISSVVFAPKVPGCAADCAYTANVAWSVTVEGTAAARACGTLSAAPDGQAPSSTTLPADLFTAASVLVVDVTYTFAPLFDAVFANALQLAASSYASPRTGDDAQWVRYTGAAAAHARCPGYAS